MNLEMHMQNQLSRARGSLRRSALIDPAELEDLLGLDNSVGRASASSLVVTEPAPAPPAAAPIAVPATRNGLFALYVDFEMRVKAMADEIRAVESELFGPGWNTTIETPSIKGMRTVAEQAILSTIRQAEKQYAPNGSRLEIDQYESLKAIGEEGWQRSYQTCSDDETAPPVDLDRLHAYLEKTYGGDAGETAAFRQQAEAMISYFGFNKPGAMTVTGRHVSCTVRVWAPKQDFGEKKGMYEMSYDSKNRLQKAISALVCAFARTEQHELAIDLRHSDLAHHYKTFKSRQKESFRGLDVIMFSDKWVYQFSHEAAAALKLFLGQYAA
jgi:hypothetical protein